MLLVGEPGLAIAACRQRKRVRFTTAAALVNQLVEAQREQSLTRMLKPRAVFRWPRWPQDFSSRWSRNVPRKAAVIVTTNLPFSEWPQVFTNSRLCKAVLDRLTDQAYIIETGAESYRSEEHWGRSEKCSPWRRRRSVLLPLRPPGYASAEQDTTLQNSTIQGWARLNRRSGQTKSPKAVAHNWACLKVFRGQIRSICYSRD